MTLHVKWFVKRVPAFAIFMKKWNRAEAEGLEYFWGVGFVTLLSF